MNIWNEQQVEHAWEVLVRFCKRGRRISSASRASSTLPFSSLSMFAIVLTAENDVRMLQQYSELLKLINLVKGNCWSMLLATMEETPLQKIKHARRFQEWEASRVQALLIMVISSAKPEAIGHTRRASAATFSTVCSLSLHAYTSRQVEVSRPALQFMGNHICL